MSVSNVIIVDYELGNMFSIRHACSYTGMKVNISSKPDDVCSAKALILPGVGAFGVAMANMKRLGLDKAIKYAVREGIPLFGVCLGMQLLFDESEEFGEVRGLGIIPGRVKIFPNVDSENKKIKVPQIGWNKIIPPTKSSWNNTPFSMCGSEEYMYFVHSFICVPDNEENILCKTNYRGIEYCSALTLNNKVIATQFHPEKSGKMGLSIYKYWAQLHKLI